MCLAVPGRVLECSENEAIVDLQGNRLRVSTALTPGAQCGDWLLIHAGFAISKIDERDALETWDYLRAAYEGDEEARQELGLDPDEVLSENRSLDRTELKSPPEEAAPSS
jgi:hydrogenase expression/formation protein HypC